MPIIRHRTGPLAGKEQSIDQNAERITFGRDPAACDVVFPADLTLVARRHFALVRRPSGEWTLDKFGDPYVAINGGPAEIGQAVHSGDVLELGQPGGPSLEVITGGKGLGSELPPTAMQHKVTGWHAATASTRRLALVGVALAAVAVLGAGAFLYFGQREGARLDKAVADLAESQRRAAADSIGPAVREKLVQAAYAVVTRLPTGQDIAGNGTASPIAPDLLATNAHVADAFNKLKDGQRLFVRAPGLNGKSYEVIEVNLHPGYETFSGFLREDPMFVTSSRDCPKCLPVEMKATTSYDVATMRVAKDANLGPVLEVASYDELFALVPGMPVGIAGYPTENIFGGGVTGVAATPNLRTGMISAMTDMFHLPGEPQYRRVITHNIPITGGSSGSPMLSSSGKLIGLVNSMNPMAAVGGGRMPNAAIINYAQRTDLLLDLLSGKAPAALAQERTYWAKQTAAFARESEYLVPWFLEQLKPKGATPRLLSESKAALTKAEQFTGKNAEGKDVARRQKIHPLEVKANSAGLFIAHARDRTAIELYVVVDGKIALQDNRPNRFIPFVQYSSKTDLKVDIYVVGGDEDVSYSIMQYAWDPPPS